MSYITEKLQPLHERENDEKHMRGKRTTLMTKASAILKHKQTTDMIWYLCQI